MINAVAGIRDWSFGANNTLSVAAFTLLYYDYALTFAVEFEHFWKSANLSLSSVHFVFNRYVGPIGTLPIIFEYFADLPEKSCRQLQTYHQVFSIAIQANIAVMLLLRTHALYERNKTILMLLIMAYASGGIACLVAILTVSSPTETQPTPSAPHYHKQCDLSLTASQGIHLSIGWCAMLWFDATIFVLTLIRALRMRRLLPGGLWEILLRDGTIYFGIMAILNVSNIITFLVSRPFYWGVTRVLKASRCLGNTGGFEERIGYNTRQCIIHHTYLASFPESPRPRIYTPFALYRGPRKHDTLEFDHASRLDLDIRHSSHLDRCGRHRDAKHRSNFRMRILSDRHPYI